MTNVTLVHLQQMQEVKLFFLIIHLILPDKRLTLVNLFLS